MEDQEHDQFVEHYHENKNRLFNYLMYRLHFDRELAEDLLMDVFTKAYENFDKFDEEKGTFKSWIFKIAHNHLINCWRKLSKNVISIEKLKEKGFEPATSGRAEDRTEMDIEKAKVQKVLLLMNESESELIALRYMHDFTNQEIVHLLGRNEGAVRTALHRALARFKGLYKSLYPVRAN